MPRKDAHSGPISAQAQQDLVSEGIENFELPKSAVTRIAKSALPDNSKLQKETVLSLVKGSTVFINYLAATAHDVAVSKQHKSISASDVLRALELMEFGDMVNTLQNELNAYRDVSKNDKGGKKSTNNNGASASAPAPGAGAGPSNGAPASTSASAAPASKKSTNTTSIPIPPPPGSSSSNPVDAAIPPSKVPLGHGLNAKRKTPAEGNNGTGGGEEDEIQEDDDDLRALGGPSGLPPSWSPSKGPKQPNDSNAMDVDDEDGGAERRALDGDEDQLMDDDDTQDQERDVQEEEEEDQEELEDTVALEDEETRKDAKTLGGERGAKEFKMAGFGAAGAVAGQS